MNRFLKCFLTLAILSYSTIVHADEAEAIAALKKIGGTVLHTDFDPKKPAKSLYLPGPKIKDEDLKLVAQLKDLQVLKLDAASNITDAGLKELASLKNLQDLGLGSTKVTDAGLKELAGFKELQKLNLNFTKVTDAGVKNLASFKKLDTLGLSFTEVTPQAIKTLQESLPKCKIIH